jgi:hypothetical protein
MGNPVGVRRDFDALENRRFQAIRLFEQGRNQSVIARQVKVVRQTVAAVPLVLMVPVIAISAFGLLQRANLSLIWLVFAAPLALFYLLVVMVLRRLSRTTAKRNV